MSVFEFQQILDMIFPSMLWKVVDKPNFFQLSALIRRERISILTNFGDPPNEGLIRSPETTEVTVNTFVFPERHYSLFPGGYFFEFHLDIDNGKGCVVETLTGQRVRDKREQDVND
jgi:hypothetical protein